LRGGIADRAQARAVPAGEPIERDREQMEIVGGIERSAEIEVRKSALHQFPDGADPLRTDRLGAALRDQHRDLPVSAAVDQDDEPSGVGRAAQRLAALPCLG
jgi:hypothetical protein